MKLLVGGLLFSLGVLYAQTPDTTVSYFDAKHGIATGKDIQQYSALKKHPLYPYLAAQFYRKHLDRDTDITPLFQQHYDALPIKKLHNLWVRHKYHAGEYATLVQYYFDSGNQGANCAYRAAQLQLGNQAAALKNIKWVWLSPRSVSAICDPVFAAWEKHNDPTYRLQRAKLAYHAGQARFAQTLISALPENHPDRLIIERFTDFYRQPQRLLEVSAASLTMSELARDLLPTALEKLVRKDSSRYAAFAMQFAVTLKDNPRYQKMLSKLTSYLANRGDPQTQYTYGLLTHPDNTATEAILRYLISTLDWRTIRELISYNSNDSMALYWLGRALEADNQNAQQIYAKAAKTRSYYGFLAADKIGEAYQFNVEPTRPIAKIQHELNQNTALIRAKSLLQYGESLDARREILQLAGRMQPDLLRQRQLAYWLDKNHFHFEAIYILGKARDWNDIAVRFPTPYNSQVTEASRQTGTDETWIYAIMRQESSMNPRAKSGARAQGLMQLIPSTARHMAKITGLSLRSGGVYDPNINTTLGAAYLAKMFDRYDNIALASAAYNAGPGRVNRWLKTDIDDMPIWVEKIPFDETRRYVKRILEYQQVYAKRLDKKIPTVTAYLNGDYQAVASKVQPQDIVKHIENATEPTIQDQNEE